VSNTSLRPISSYPAWPITDEPLDKINQISVGSRPKFGNFSSPPKAIKETQQKKLQMQKRIKIKAKII
jgi:hypothetical protein